MSGAPAREAAAQALSLLAGRGGAAYLGEPVTQLEHALQAADLAARAGEADELVVACLLHDVGWLLAADGASGSGTAGSSGVRAGTADGSGVRAGTADGGESGAGHAGRGATMLAPLFGPAVSEPVRLHVAAKRFLAGSEPGFVAQLSEESRRTLALQGGPLTGEELARFPSLPHAGAALALRRYDDAAKVVERSCPPLEAYADLVSTLARTT